METSNKQVKTDVENASLSGPVKQVKQICYKANNPMLQKFKYQKILQGKVEEGEYLDKTNYAVSFDNNGRKTEEHDLNFTSRHTKKYNEQGFLIKEISYYIDEKMEDNSKIMSCIEHKYDANGNAIETLNYHSVYNPADKTSALALAGRTTNKYDDTPRLEKSISHIPEGKKAKVLGRGNVIESIGYNAQGEIIHKTTSKYNEHGLALESISYSNFNGKPTTSTTRSSYDDRGNCIEFKMYDAADALIRHDIIKYKYDKQGKKIEFSTRTLFQNETFHSYAVSRCNEYEDVIEVKHYDENNVYLSTVNFTHEYDEHGNKTASFNQFGDQFYPFYGEKPKEKLSSETEEFEYDAHNNWITKTTYYSSNTQSRWKKVPVNLYVREISYYGEEKANEKTLGEFFTDLKAAHDKKYPEHDSDDDNDTEKQKPMKSKLTAKQTEWVSEAIVPNDYFPIFRYYAAMYNDTPSLVTYTGPFIEAHELLEELKENMDAQVVHSFSTVWDQQGEVVVRYVLSFPEHPGYLLRACHIQGQSAEEFEIPEFMQPEDDDAEIVYLSQLELLRPSDISGRRGSDDEDFPSEAREFEQELEDYINKCSLKKKPDQPTIYMIETANNGFSLVSHPVNNDFEIKDLDVNYGYGFTQFHNELMQRFNTQTKGLVLFHGLPGTGKTYYIRHLLRKMATGNKAVIYMPPNMVDHLVEPAFMTFISNEVKEFSEEGNFCVLLIEDAEPLLAKRQEGVRIQGVTNLLNMTDGLLNDMLNLQIICTFNVDLQRLDSALLRPGRLIARKEFKALSELDANLLASRLGIKHHFTAPATLSEVYALLKDKSTLIHDVDPDKGASNILDDL
jgi:hypothetical protein